ncbi:hypothetical protein ACLBX9_03450 [Methylobacterium sp. A49B]|uniref:DUF1508 domain-containing protein n=1 Tax=Methylobacterium mesophilicum SR1.6/6 TaxID=908290 RepID=A0A6B9FPS5_9HYPH|nr:hypothetical protein [Methylobacterium mesophilicum]QGY04643.1 hypothetical protein MMSR116_24065 [Methylobacterium mesophilicum SR1.6/6]
MHFQIRQDGDRWSWVLLGEADETIAESDQTFPSAAQASAAALAFAHLVARAGKSLTVTPSGTLPGTLL